LTKQGLLYQQIFRIEEGLGERQFVLNIEVLLWHRSGQFLSSVFTVPYKGGEANLHSMGSFITYFRRYSLLAFLGLATYDNTDDDGTHKGLIKSEPVVEPVVESGSAVEPAVESESKPVVEPVVELAVESESEPVVEPVVESGSAVEPAVESESEPVVESGSAVEPAVESGAESAVEPVVESESKPVVEPVVESGSAVEPAIIERTKVLSSLVFQLPNDKRDKFILWASGKGYYSNGNLNLDQVGLSELDRIIANVNSVVLENNELDALKQDIMYFLENHREYDIPALGRGIGVESVESVHDFSCSQLKELKELCRQKVMEAWNGVRPRKSVETISQSQKEEIQRLWSQSGLGDNSLFKYFSDTLNLEVESYYDIPASDFEELCVALPDIAERITEMVLGVDESFDNSLDV
jgi:hypothetical protein